MNKPQYLKVRIVDQFVDHFADLLQGRPFPHEFVVRDRALPRGYRQQRLVNGVLKLGSMEQAFNAYWWDSQDFEANKTELERIQALVRRAIAAEHTADGTDQCLLAVREVLKWGAGGEGSPLFRANHGWAVARRDSIVARIKAGREAMTSDVPDLRVFRADDGPRMNAGFTKYFALACDGVVIYDGRVGAALGLAVKDFCVQRNLDSVPEELSFRWGAQNPGKRNPELALYRNPTDGCYKFAALPTAGGPQWARCNVLANWILGAAQERAREAAWCQGAGGLRRIEAGLFTLGYSLPRPVARRG
jgi:hypothetical protein